MKRATSDRFIVTKNRFTKRQKLIRIKRGAGHRPVYVARRCARNAPRRKPDAGATRPVPSVAGARLARAMDPLGLTKSARDSFPGYYAAATPLDAVLLDNLVMAHAAFVIMVNAPREHVEPVVRAEVERKTNETEIIFTGLREAVRLTPAFKALSKREQDEIDRVVFTVRPALFP